MHLAPAVRRPLLALWPDENHWVLKGENSRYFYQQVHAWMARWLH